MNAFMPTEAVHSQAHAFSLQSKMNPQDVFVTLAADDDASRQRCLRVLRAAIDGDTSAFKKDVASVVAITPHLIAMNNLSVFNCVAALLGRPSASGLDAKSLRQAGFGAKELDAVGFCVWDVINAGIAVTEYSIVSAAACPPCAFLLWPAPFTCSDRNARFLISKSDSLPLLIHALIRVSCFALHSFITPHHVSFSFSKSGPTYTPHSTATGSTALRCQTTAAAMFRCHPSGRSHPTTKTSDLFAASTNGAASASCSVTARLYSPAM
jgi:hypothetical protein